MIGAGGKQKFAADAGLRRALQALSRTIPEQVRAFKASGRYARPEPRGWLESMLWSHAIPEKDAALVRSVANYYIPRTTKGRQLAFMEQLQKWRADNTHLGSKRRYLRSEALRESRERDLVKQMASGFHPPRANEYVIPASISGEFVVDASRGRSPFLFRGGEMAKDWRLATRHPDVAAAYATSRAGSHGTTSGIMKVLRRDRLVNAGEAAADSGTLTKILKTNERGLSKLRNLERKTSNYEQLDARYRTFGPAGHRGHSAGTYEAVVKPKPGRNPVVGEYRVRPVRLPDGTPGYGLTTLSGVPAPKVFSLVK